MQELIVFFLVMAAAIYLARSFWLSGKGDGCGGCAKKGCAKPEETLIQISLDKK